VDESYALKISEKQLCLMRQLLLVRCAVANDYSACDKDENGYY